MNIIEKFVIVIQQIISIAANCHCHATKNPQKIVFRKRFVIEGSDSRVGLGDAGPMAPLLLGRVAGRIQTDSLPLKQLISSLEQRRHCVLRKS